MSSHEEQKVSMDGLPHFLAVNYQATLEAADARACVQAGLNTFSLGLRFLTIIVTSQYLIQDERSVSDPYLNKLLMDRFPLGDLQIWSNVFITMLKAYEGLGERLFLPELYDFYWDTRDPAKHHPKEEIVQGVVRLVALSNDFQLNKNLPQKAEEWEKLASEVKTLLGDLLGRLKFLQNYELLRILSIKQQNRYVAELHMGLEIKNVEFDYGAELLRPNWYYLGREYRRFLQLNPLLVPWEAKLDPTALFERMTQYERLFYLLIQTGELLADQSRLNEFLELIEVINKKIGIFGKKDLTWLQVSATAQEISAARMATVAGKYDKAVFLQRGDLVEQVQAFMASEARCFVLTGKSGAGKSNFILSLADEYSSEPDICLLAVDATQIDTKKGLGEFLTDEFRRHWGWQSHEMQNFFEELNQLQGMERKKFILVLDAINENEDSRALLKQINELIQQPWKWLKVLITSRPEAWRRMYYGLPLAEGLFFQQTSRDVDAEEQLPLSAYTVKPFSEVELPLVYERYQVKYELKSGYGALSPEMQQLIREPLQLWMVSNTYHGKAIPAHLSEWKLIESYLKALLETKRLWRDDLHFLQAELVPLMALQSGKYTNSLTAGALETKGNGLLDRVFSEGQYSTGERVNASFQRLADAQIVVAQLRGIDSELKFKYERFYDHFLGKYLHDKVPEWYADPIKGYRSLLGDTEAHPFLWGAVQVALWLALEEGKIADIKALSVDENPLMRHMLTPVLTGYAQEKPEAVRGLAYDLLALEPPRKMMGRAEYPRDILGAKEIAAEIAFELRDAQALSQVICDGADLVSEVGVRFVYALDRKDHQKAIDVLEKVGQQTMRRGLPRFNILRRFLMLSLLLLMEGNLGEELNDGENELWSVFFGVARRVAYVNQGSPQLFGNFLRTFLVGTLTRVVITLLGYMASSRKDSGDRKTAVNLDELTAIYKITSFDKKQAARDLIPYLDRTHAKSLDEAEAALLAAFRQSYGWTTSMGNQIASTYGFFEPDWAQQLCHKIYDCDDGREEVRLDAAIVWYQVVKRQPQIKDEWLETGKALLRKCLDNNQHGYGRFISSLSGVQQYPLLFYIALYNRKYPQRPNDLVEHYLAQAESTHDRRLLLHLIDTLADRRAYLVNYLPVLSSFIPYLQADYEDQEIHEHLAVSLAAIRGMFPEQIDHFLLVASVPRDFAEEVRRQSYQYASLSLYLRVADFVYDLSIYGNEKVRKLLMDLYILLVNGKSFAQALESVIRMLLNELYGNKGGRALRN